MWTLVAFGNAAEETMRTATKHTNLTVISYRRIANITHISASRDVSSSAAPCKVPAPVAMPWVVLSSGAVDGALYPCPEDQEDGKSSSADFVAEEDRDDWEMRDDDCPSDGSEEVWLDA